jgi:Transposase and inactivated derivatives
MRRIEDLFLIIKEQSIKIEYLMRENAYLRRRIEELEKPKKNSGNSSTPPSQDPYRKKKTESLREKSGKKQGGQPGHKGTTLEFSANPDRVETHIPDYCQNCGRDLSDLQEEFAGSRQVIDIPPIVPVVTEHRVYKKVCTCGCCSQSSYPQEAHSKVCYGENIISLAAYFSTRQYLSYERLKEMFSDVFSVKLSQGTLVNLMNRFTEKASIAYNHIKSKLMSSSVLGADETSVCVNGKIYWAWTFQNDKYTCIEVNQSRGQVGVDTFSKEGFPNSIITHDCWATYFKTEAGGHQICTAHLLRELKYLEKLHPKDKWAKQFKDLLLSAIKLKQELREVDYLYHISERKELEDRLDRLLNREINPKYKKTITFKKRIIKYRAHLFTFLYHYKVPHHNNASEQAVRTFKVKQKVSGLFRSPEGAISFATIRSVIDTAIKNSQRVLPALKCVAKVEAE